MSRSCHGRDFWPPVWSSVRGLDMAVGGPVDKFLVQLV